MSNRRVVCGRRLTVHRCEGDDRLLVVRIRTRKLDVRFALKPSAADLLRGEIETWCDEIGYALVGAVEEDGDE